MRESFVLDEKGTPYIVDERLNTIGKANVGDADFFYGGRGTGLITDTITSKPYKYSTWVYSCIRVIVWNLCRLPLQLLDAKTLQKVDAHPILDLLKQPNSMMTWMTFRQAVLLNMLLPQRKDDEGGQCFIIPWNSITDKPANITKGELPTELLPFPSCYFEPKYETTSSKSKMRRLAGWTYKSRANDSGEEVSITFTNDEIIRIQFYNPYDAMKGLAPLVAASLAVEQDARTDVYNAKLFENDGRVSGVLTSTMPINEDQARQYTNRWRQNYSGVGNVGKIAVLGNDLKYQQLGLSLSDMQWMEQKKWSKDQIIAAHGLNKIALGDYEQINYATIKEGRKLLWYDTYMPIDSIFWDAFVNQWIKNIDKGKYTMESDFTRVEALQEDFKGKATTMGDMVQRSAFPPELAARIAGVPLTAEDLVRWPHLSEVVKAAPATPSPSDSGSGEEAKKIKSRVVSKAAITGEAKDAMINAYIEKVLDPGEKSFLKELDKYFYRQRNAMQDRVDEWLSGQKAVDVNPTSFLLSEEDELAKFVKTYKPAVGKQLEYEYKQLEKELGSIINWNFDDTTITRFTKMRTAYLKDINTNTFKVARNAIAKVTEKAMTENLTPQETAKAIKQAVSDVYETRFGRAPSAQSEYYDLGGMSSSKTIARTEMGSVSSLARQEAFRAEGIDKQQWLTSKDDKVRDSHVELDEQITKVGEAFPGSDLRFPRDPNGAPEEVINCRCVAVAYFED
jgi:HK97 family phage portal protein